jgi:hypothetical protein
MFGGAAGDEDQDPVVDEPELVLPDPDELPEWLHPLAMDDEGDPDGGLGAVDGVDVPDEPDVPEEPDVPDVPEEADEPEELVEDPEVDDDSTAVDPVVDDLALVEAPATDMPTPKLKPKAPRATPAASTGLLRFMVDPPLRANLTRRLHSKRRT